MADYFCVTRELLGPTGAVFHGERPNVDRDADPAVRQRLRSSGSPILYGPTEIPAALKGASIPLLMNAWRCEKRKAAAAGPLKADISPVLAARAAADDRRCAVSGRPCEADCAGIGVCAWAAWKIRNQQLAIADAAERAGDAR